MLMCKCDRCGTVYKQDYHRLLRYGVEKNDKESGCKDADED